MKIIQRIAGISTDTWNDRHDDITTIAVVIFLIEIEMKIWLNLRQMISDGCNSCKISWQLERVLVSRPLTTNLHYEWHSHHLQLFLVINT